MMRCPPPLGVAGHEELWSPSACSTSNCLLHLAYVTLVTSSPKISLPFKASMTGHLLRVSQKWLAHQATWLITSPCLCHQAKSLLSKPPRRTGHAMVVNKIWACSRTCVEVKMMMCPKVDLPHLACVAKLKACFIVTKLTRFNIERDSVLTESSATSDTANANKVSNLPATVDTRWWSVAGRTVKCGKLCRYAF
ncbi:hypothetical protein TIFTF001_034089 [Ficus carica]|uniref:Uncharacterized protein n=3 Tax=Ficus carica TaxID=3494 RepID=A0AA88E0H6_FICCA|nr:hypothetical protein TIFTF001_034089 [Ficus carica]